LFGDDFGDDGKVNDGLFSDFEAGVFSKREKLESNELFAKGLSKDFAHVGEELYSDNSVFLVGVIVGHFDNMSEDEITSFVIVDFLGELAEVLASFFFDLGYERVTSRGLKLRKSMRHGMRMDLMVYWGLSCFLRYWASSGILCRNIREIS
jgi:hypothetical protein